jgi:hypothetical protein
VGDAGDARLDAVAEDVLESLDLAIDGAQGDVAR